MKTPTTKVPTYRRQKRKNRPDDAFVELNGQRHYLGHYGSPESKHAFKRMIAEWLAGDGLPPVSRDAITVSGLILRYYRWCGRHYRDPQGNPTREIDNIKAALKPLRDLYGQARAAEFGPLCLKTVRQACIDAGLSRGYINKNVGQIKRMYKWGVAEELVEPSVYQALLAVEGLKRGRSDARETHSIKPVPDAFVDAVRPHVSRQVWAIVQLQRLTAARPGELVVMRPVDIDMTGRIWLYRPQCHKTAHRDRERVIYIGRKGQEVLRPFLAGRAVDAFLFSPREADQERRAKLHSERKTPMSCGNRPGTNRRADPGRQPGDHYTTVSYRRAIQYACDKAFPVPDEILREKDDEKKAALKDAWEKEHRWHPHQLRHNAATYLRKEFGLEAAQLMLGHAKADITQVYAELNHAKAIEVAGKIG